MKTPDSTITAESSALDSDHSTASAPTKPKQKTKIGTILRVLVPGRSLNRFEAEQHHDHCLHSTVSALQRRYGIDIERKSETVPCLGGTATASVKRYWLDTNPDNIARARALLEFWA